MRPDRLALEPTEVDIAMDAPTLAQFPAHAYDKLRYADTDRQGHVNNSVFSTALETGRVELLHAPDTGIVEADKSFVIARLELDFRGELTWPGEVAIGTKVTSVGRSSITLAQGLFQHDRCVALASTVIVQVDERTHRATPLSEAAAARLRELQS
jgi:acyl-CoA thioester hydrolase